MPRQKYPSIFARRNFVLVLSSITLLSWLALPGQHLKWLLPSVSANTTGAAKGTNSAEASALASPGAISFSAPSHNVKEGDGSSNITLTRTGGSDGVLTAKVTLADVTTSPADYRFRPGSLDSSFITPPQVSYGSALSYSNPSMALQPDGKLLVADSRTVWRLLPDGTMDPTFTVGATNNLVYTVALQPNGKIIIGGGFTTFNNQRTNGIARLNSDGSLDTTFNTGSGANDAVRLIAVQADGKMLISGDFSSFNGANVRFARLNADGSLDTSYSYDRSFRYAIALQPDGKALVGGSGGIERVNTDGTIDNTFHVNFSGSYPSVSSILLQPDGKILIASGFDHIDGQIVYSIARLDDDGSLDPTFSTGTGTDSGVGTMALQPDGKILVGGYINSYNGTAVQNLLRINANGSFDTTFTHGFTIAGGNPIYNILLQPDGKILIRGGFTVYSTSEPAANRYLARLHNDLFVTWPAGDTSNKTISLPIVDDSVLEPSETLNLSVTPLTSDATTGANPTATLTIADNDTRLSAISGTGTFFGTPTLTATLASYGSNLSGKTITFSIFGASVGTATTDANGVATLTNGFINYNAGTYPTGVGASFAGDTTYAGTSSTGQLTINKATATITLGGLSQTYSGGPKFATATTNPPGLSGVTISYSQNGTPVTSPTNVGSYDLVAKLSSNINYQASDVTGTLVINKGAPNIFWNNPANIIVGTPLGSAQLNASANVPGTFQYNPTAGTVLPLGVNQLSVTFTPTDAVNYNSASKSVQLTVIPIPPPALTFSFASYGVSEVAGNVPINVTRTGDAALAVSVNFATGDNAGLTSCNTFNGVASSRCDYANTIGTLRFAAGETSKTIFIPVVNDSYAEGTERLTVRLSNPSSGAGIGSVPLATVTITDDDAVTGSINPITDPKFFIRQQYIDFLGREPDPVGWQGWQDILNNCPPTDKTCDRISVSSGFFRSPEFQDGGYFVYRFYPVALGRAPHYSEFMPDMAKVSGFLTEAEKEANKVAFVQEFMTRPEFSNRYGPATNPTIYVDGLLQTCGIPNHPSRDAWIAQLTGGTITRAQVLRALTESPEVYAKFYNESFVVMQYFGYLRRDPDILYLEWIKIMNQNGGNYHGMIEGFINSSEYFQRFGP